jgi:hypothetical protein
VWQLLNHDSADAVIEHTISAGDIAGPFDKNIPADWVARSKLKGMYYASPLQEFTGKYHATEALLRRLNPGQAHLDRYASGTREGASVHKGDLLGYVGSSGNASPDAPHLHLAIFRLSPEKQWWVGTAINPYPLLVKILDEQK